MREVGLNYPPLHEGGGLLLVVWGTGLQRTTHHVLSVIHCVNM